MLRGITIGLVPTNPFVIGLTISLEIYRTGKFIPIIELCLKFMIVSSIEKVIFKLLSVLMLL